jgi:hypothetical protein
MENEGRKLFPSPPHPRPPPHWLLRTPTQTGSPPHSPRPRNRPGRAPKLPPLLSHTLPFIIGTVGLPPHHILRQSDPPPPRVTAHTPKTLRINTTDIRKVRSLHKSRWKPARVDSPRG